MDAPVHHASQGRLSVIVVSIIPGKSSDPQPPPILRLSRLSRLSMSRRDRPRGGPEEAPLNPASHPPPPHGPYGLPGQRWRQARGS